MSYTLNFMLFQWGIRRVANPSDMSSRWKCSSVYPLQIRTGPSHSLDCWFGLHLPRKQEFFHVRGRPYVPSRRIDPSLSYHRFPENRLKPVPGGPGTSTVCLVSIRGRISIVSALKLVSGVC
jgi:hypothetical protein